MLQVDRIVNSIFDSITWLLSETESNWFWLVDCGDIAPILDKVKEKTVVGVLLTHVHYDHIYGLPEILARYPKCLVYTNVAGKEGLKSDKLNLSKYHDDSIILEESRVRLVTEGEEIKLFNGTEANVYETPGHNPSCLCFEVKHHLFTGDAYIPGFKPVTNLPGGKMDVAKQSYKRIEAMLQDKIVCPGHVI